MPKIQKKPWKRISLDVEACGLDLYHSARPFFVTICDISGSLSWWEWSVDPLTRMPIVSPEDLAEVIRGRLDSHVVVSALKRFLQFRDRLLELGFEIAGHLEAYS